MNKGRIIFQGSPLELTRQACGKVWTMTGPRPAGESIVVSTVKTGTTVCYRVVGELSDASGATPVEPCLEDSYVWLVRERRAPKFP